MRADETSHGGAATGGIRWSENIIIADGGYIDRVAFNLIVNFERMIGRRIPPADMARWLDCIALDGGVRPGAGQTQVALLHDKGSGRLENFVPSDYDKELSGQAFRDNLGEFVLTSLAVEAVTTTDQLLRNILGTVMGQEAVRRVMVVADTDDGATYDMLCHTLRDAPDDKRVTVFTMQPLAGGNFRQEILGYSLMSALGIRADEIKS